MPIRFADLAHSRWRIPTLLAVTLLIHYADRNHVALVMPRMAEDFGWSDREMGAYGELLLGGFYVPYALANMVLSPRAERFGAKRSLMIAIGMFSVITSLNAPLGQSLSREMLLEIFKPSKGIRSGLMG